jgi:hypothetical protein
MPQELAALSNMSKLVHIARVAIDVTSMPLTLYTAL